MQRFLAVALSALVGACDATEPRANPPAAITYTGATQFASLGAKVPEPPVFVVLDADGNPVPNVAVAFVIRSGNGTVTPASRRTDARGRAPVDTWTLGPVPGWQALEASVTGVAPAIVEAFARNACPPEQATNILVGNTIAGALTTSDCTQGVLFADLYRLSLDRQSALRLVATPGDYSISGSVLYRYADPENARVLLPPGAYAFKVVGARAGSYAVEARAESEDLDACAYVFAVRGVATSQTLTRSNCSQDDWAPDGYADVVRLPMLAGETVTITMTSTVFTPALELWSDWHDIRRDATGVASATNTSRITFTADNAYDYIIVARAAGTGSDGPYTLTIQ